MQRILFVAFFLVGLSIATVLNASTGGDLVVGPVTARPGEAASGWLEVPAGKAVAGAAGLVGGAGAPDVSLPAGLRGSGPSSATGLTDSAVRIPITVINGARPGPVLALVAGTHGYEYTSVFALQRLRPRLDPARMSGAVIMVHMANPPGFYGRRVYYGPDGKNLNRVYPGRTDGTQTERIAEILTREVIDKCTHLADMHCGDGNESLRPYSYWAVSGNASLDEASRQMVLAYGLDHIVIDRERPKDPARSIYTADTATLRGKPSITTESGGMGLTDEGSVAAHEAGALSLIAHLGIMEAPSVRVDKPVWIDRAEVVRAPSAGIWRPVVEKMQSVATGTLIGRIVDPFGAVLHEVRSPFAGEVLYVVATPPINEQEPLAMVGHPSDGETGP